MLLKNLFKRKPAPKRRATGKINPSPLVRGTKEAGLMGMVTHFDAVNDGPVAVVDAEGSLWEANRSGDMIYLSGDDGEVQAQFPVEPFREFLNAAHSLSR